MERKTPKQLENDKVDGLNSIDPSIRHLALDKRSREYWDDWENVKKEMGWIVDDLGRFPKAEEVKDTNRPLYNGIKKLPGGLRKVKSKMGFTKKRKKFTRFRDWNVARSRLNKILLDRGELPTGKELKKSSSRENKRLYNAINRYHGGMKTALERFESEREEIKRATLEEGRKPQGYWANFKNVRNELDKETEEFGHFPTTLELEAKNRRDIIDACYTYHGGYNTVKQRMGEETHRKEGTFWDKWKNFKKEMHTVIDDLGHFPTQRDLRTLKRGDLATAAQKRHGGLGVVRERMGYGVQEIKNRTQLVKFLKKDKTARNLAAVSLALNGEAYDVEQVMLGLYEDRFKDQGQLHALLDANKDEVVSLIQEGITNLGAYIGEFALGDRSIIPVLLGEAIMQIPADKLTATLEDKLVRIQRTQYGPRFNDNPAGTLEEISTRANETEGRVKNIYQRLQEHYQGFLELGGELG